MSAPRVLIVDDEPKLVSSLIFGLKAYGVAAEGAFTAADGLAAATRSRPDLMLLDLRLPDASGIDVLHRLRAQSPPLPVVVISAHGDIRVAVEAIKLGALDFITKPFDLDDIVSLVRTAREGGKAGAAKLTPDPDQDSEDAQFLGNNPRMVELREQIELVARSSTRIVLLLGASGTGKGVVSRLLHARSARAHGPFVVANCAALPEALMEAELFGAERGAYTGAYQRRAGLVELAEGGTLFLDEIAELPLTLQAKLLHFLERRSFRPLGSGRERQADVRVIAATNRNLEEAVREGHFRADLFYRLNVVPLLLPRLVEHSDDIPLLANYYARRSAATEGCAPITFDVAAEAMLLAHPWPGNVRELKHLIERLTILYPGQVIGRELLVREFGLGAGSAGGPDLEAQLAATERTILHRALREAGGHKGKAAERLGISRHALKRRLQRLNLASTDG